MTKLVCMMFLVVKYLNGITDAQLLYKFLLNVNVEFQGCSMLIFKDVKCGILNNKLM